MQGVDYQSMPLQCIGFIGSQYAIGMILVSKEARFRVDSNDSSPMCITCKTKKLFKFFLEVSMNRVFYSVLQQALEMLAPHVSAVPVETKVETYHPESQIIRKVLLSCAHLHVHVAKQLLAVHKINSSSS